MLLTITTTRSPATDLGYLLHKNPERLQAFNLSFGRAHVFYPERSAERCTAALLVDVDPVGLSRRDGEGTTPLQPYVNDRPYAASSLLSVAIAQVYGAALAGRSKERPAVADEVLPLVAELPALPCHGGEPLVRRLFEPLGYEVMLQQHPLDEQHPEWGPGSLYALSLRGDCRLRELLGHLYVLIPVLDNEKHYWVGQDEIDKLLRHGAGWLAAHPERELIARRYLRNQQSLARRALARLSEGDPSDPDALEQAHAAAEQAIERPLTLNEQRIDAVVATLREEGARRVVDLGCGEGRLLHALLRDRSFDRIVGMDVAHRSLEIAADRLDLETLPPARRARIDLMHGSLFYRDKRLTGFDAACVVEVIEHLDPPRLDAFARVLFECTRPRSIIITTPNAEYNVRFDGLGPGAFRHRDHRFEWTRAEFTDWSNAQAARWGYSVRQLPIGPIDPELGSPTQMAVFRRAAATPEVMS